MEDAVNIEDKKIMKMGASNISNASRIKILQERKKQIEDTLAKRNQELRELCIKEAELTGITPPEMPLEPGETLPLIRRRVKTAFELPEDLVVNINKDTSVNNLELEIELNANLAEAALALAKDQNISKTVRRQHRAEYQKYKNQYIALQDKLTLLKEKAIADQYKQKKKPRDPDQKSDAVSINTTFNDPFVKSDIRQSVRSAKQSLPSPSEDQRFSHIIPRHVPCRNSEMLYTENQPVRQEEILNSGFYRLSLNGYNKYMERREKVNSMQTAPNYNPYTNPIPYSMSHNSLQEHGQQHSPHYQQSSPHGLQHSPLISHSSSHSSQHSPHMSHHTSRVPQQSPRLSQHNPHMPKQHNPQILQYSPQLTHQRSPIYNNHTNYMTDINKFTIGGNHFANMHLHRQSSPPVPQKSQYFPCHTIHGQTNYHQYQSESTYRSPHQIQSHQQYEHVGIMTVGLGGCWKKTESGELVWCTSNTTDVSWQKDKRFGSLDRRKNKRLHKRISPSIDHSLSASNYPDQVKNPSVKLQITSRRTQDNGQLVRTQSLGSVGIQTVDSVYPSDDNSSYESDNRSSINDVNQMLRKNREKEWLETSLDGPVSPSQISNSSLQPANPVVLPSDEKYSGHSLPPPVPPSLPSKPPLEIPAESNPSPRLSETNIELFNNNNIPKNCTLVQAGHCKPYHEETKPFEMSDFYKYSTKFKKSPIKGESEASRTTPHGTGNVARNLNEVFTEGLQDSYSTPSKNQLYNNSGSTSENLDNSCNLNTSMELGHITVSDHFSAEMNAWYKDQQKNNTTGNASKSRSTATLV